MNTLKDVIDQADDYQKVNDALKQLKELDSTLVKLDRSKLEKIIKKYQELKEEDYTVDSWQQMKEILDATQAVYDNPSLNQKDIDQAIASFDGVQLDQSKYTKESWDKLQETLQKAKDLATKEDVSQEELESMLASLNDAYDALKEIKTDTINTANKTDKTNTTNKNTAKTGDDVSLFGYVGLLCIALLGFIYSKRYE